MEEIKVLDKKFTLFISHEVILEAVRKIAARIDSELGGSQPLFLGILNGAFMFSSDLFKELKTPSRISFVKMASYLGTGSTGKVHQLIGLQESLADQHVVILEDIIDSGLTVQNLLEHIHNQKPASVRIATLFYKPDAFKGDYTIDFIGLEIPNDFVVGFGLDYNGFGRNLRNLYSLNTEQLVPA